MSHRSDFQPLEPRRMFTVDVLTYHNDNALNGLNAAETTLAPSNVNSTQFGKLFSAALDGNVYAQPLVKTGVSIPGQGVHDVVFLATEHDSVYAFDANAPGRPLWQRSFINPSGGVTTVPFTDVGTDNTGPEIGITSTPVIDPATNTMYVLAETKEVGRHGRIYYRQRLHALDITTGSDKLTPVILSATVAGRGDGGTTISYNALIQNQRPSLTLANGNVYVASASHADQFNYHGWILAYRASDLAQIGVWNNTPNGEEGGIWQSGAGLSADASGNLYVSSGNGTFTANVGGRDYGDTVTRLTPTLGVSDYFAPFNQAQLAANDQDLGSGGVVLLPDSAGNGTHPHLAVFAGKEGRLYLADRDNLGHFNATSDRVVQELPGALGGAFGTPAFFNGKLYYAASGEGDGDRLKAFPISNAHVGKISSFSADGYVFPGSTPAVSANGTTNGIVWTISTSSATDVHAVLKAYDASNLATRLYSSDDAGSRDQFGTYNKFQTPTIANGKVYAAVKGGFAVFGELPPITSTLASAPTLRTNAAGYTFSVTYHSNVGASLDPSSFGNGDVFATTPRGYSAAAQLVSATKGKRSSTYTVTYQIPGVWAAANNGTYSLVVQSGQVRDFLGNSTQQWEVGTFTVRIA